MVKENNDKLPNEGELYGKFWEAVSWSAEEKHYQHLSNLIFMAAKADIIAEKKAEGTYKKKIHNQDDDDYTENLDKVLKEIIPDTKDKKGNLIDQTPDRNSFKRSLIDGYSQLKNDLDDVRVFGVGNSNLQAAAKACKIAVKTMVVLCAAPAIAAAALASAFIASPFAPLIATAAGGAIGHAAEMAVTKSKHLMDDRSYLKEHLRLTNATKFKKEKKQEGRY